MQAEDRPGLLEVRRAERLLRQRINGSGGMPVVGLQDVQPPIQKFSELEGGQGEENEFIAIMNRVNRIDRRFLVNWRAIQEIDGDRAFVIEINPTLFTTLDLLTSNSPRN
jgi:hypothetical protein